MAGIKSLAKDTAIYGVSSIVGRFLNWLLVPLYTVMFPVEEYGVVTFVYSVVALVMVILIYGMETGFFRFTNHERWNNPTEVYGTCLTSLAVSSSVFAILVTLFSAPLSHAMECDGHPSYVVIMGWCVAIDAFSAIPFCYLRYRKRPIRFAMLKLINIGLNIGLNLFFILLCPWLATTAPGTVSWFYRPDFGIGYIFLANLLASAITMLMLVPDVSGFKWHFNRKLWADIMRYSLPLLVLGIAGIMNQTIDKLLYPHLVSDHADAMYGLGIYGANYKIAVLLLVFLQAFRFAYEPFIFARDKNNGEQKLQAYRDAMTYFVAFALLIFLGVMYYLDIVKYLISPNYFSGLKIVPLIMLGELFFGIFYNLSVWYKLTDRTQWGMWFSLLGLGVTLALNIILVPRIGYMGCAIAAFSCYLVMMLASYFVGLKKYPIGYPVGRILSFFAIAGVFYILGVYLLPMAGLHAWVNGGIRFVLLAAFVVIFAKIQGITLAQAAEPIVKFIRRR